jgi:hypothetical protein
MSVIRCLQTLVDEYNKDVLVNYDPFFTMEINRQWNQVAGDIQDSFYNGADSQLFYANIDGIMSNGNGAFLVLGAGPVGLEVANALCLQYPNSSVLLYDSRSIAGGPPHRRPNYSRYRSLAGLQGITIKQVEETRLLLLQNRPNIYTLYHPRLNVEAMVKRYASIKFVFNCTGGRTTSLLNSVTDTLHIGRSLPADIDGEQVDENYARLNPRFTTKRPRLTNTRIASDDSGNTYKLNFDGKMLTYAVNPADTFIKMSTEYVITISQGEISIDIWASSFPPIVENAPNGILTDNYENTVGFINELYNQGYIIHPPNRQITLDKLVVFNPAQPFKATSFKAGLKLSRRNLCQIHHFTPFNYVVKFDLGESMGSLPITSGSNIATATKVLNRNVLPIVARMLDCIQAFPNDFPLVQVLLN